MKKKKTSKNKVGRPVGARPPKTTRSVRIHQTVVDQIVARYGTFQGWFDGVLANQVDIKL
jgi:uncharacterized protein (DUF4415 family)